MDNLVKNQEFTQRVAAYLERQTPGARGMTASVRRMMGGRSWDIFGVTAHWEEGGAPREREFVFRVAPPGGILEPHDPSFEFHLLQAYERRGLPVPRAYWLEMDPAVLGAPFYVMEWVRAEIPQLDHPRFEDPAEKDRYGRQFAEVLARIHTLDWRAEGLDAFLPPAGVPGGDPIERELAWCEQRMSGLDIPPTPALRAVLQWLHANRPRMRPEEVRLVYGDYRFDNFFWKDGKIVALLDYEMALLGHPMEDIAFTRMLSGWAAVHGDFARHYEEASGIPVDEALVGYFMVLKTAQINITVGLAALNGLNQGKVRDARDMAVVGGFHVSSARVLGQLLKGPAR
ncbi:MAG: phosphotransferase family protein [Dehalococcoidia bacterium]|nr:phosphotransferase family protein [Dehalococcoidia bacterium]